ncbi:hypothetical protein [Thiomicrorhabdus sp.]|uniref:hypothetical protein n=1 Tax=Thiomicrorhabdus sp. TaxID=2039724 RepID=UPI002AA70676|nr:hypothetical protein [Thiomicrorhabdus sp.]
MSQFDFAIQAQLNQNSTEKYQVWIKSLLVEYEDPMYDYQMQKNNHSVVFKGSISEMVEYLKLTFYGCLESFKTRFSTLDF